MCGDFGRIPNNHSCPLCLAPPGWLHGMCIQFDCRRLYWGGCFLVSSSLLGGSTLHEPSYSNLRVGAVGVCLLLRLLRSSLLSVLLLVALLLGRLACLCGPLLLQSYKVLVFVSSGPIPLLGCLPCAFIWVFKGHDGGDGSGGGDMDVKLGP
jgi:hypothetical protein